jgi:cyanophycin synthetase
MTIANYKGLTRQVLERAHLPMAQGGVFANKRSGMDFAKKAGFPLVFKPGSGAHGQGVVVGIKKEEDLESILDKNKHKKFILETMLAGRDFRVVVINFKFFAATMRLPAFVTGNGKLTLSELVAKENKRPQRKTGHKGILSKIVIDDLVEAYVREQGLSWELIPEQDVKIFLRKTANLSTGGVGVDVTDEVGIGNRKIFEKIAVECDLNTAGIDVMADNLKEPLSQQEKAGILEVNASPGLRMHHYPYQGEPRNVAGALLDFVIESKDVGI